MARPQTKSAKSKFKTPGAPTAASAPTAATAPTTAPTAATAPTAVAAMPHPSKPLYEISGLDAIENRKTNPLNGWGRRDEPNRVEPIATPGFDVPFQFVAGESIYTIGSCFARNVEVSLMNRGFDVPVRKLFKQPEYASINPGIINNFGTPSIFNEFSWALDPATPYDFDSNIVEVGAGKFVDLHVIPSERPAAREVIAARRSAIIEITKAVTTCRVVIMTLGLVELWYDKQNGVYLNATVLPSLVKKFPDRFSLRVLDFNETKSYLDKALDLLKTYCRPDQQILLTVSPVPLASTFRMQDVMVANAYSKSVLRTVAEHIVAQRDNVHYYPSYESVTLSERKEVWQDDFTHVTDKIVQVNIGRMVAAFVPQDASAEASWAEFEQGGASVVLARASEYIDGKADAGLPFLQNFAHILEQSPDFAFAAASAYYRWSMFDEAMDAITKIPADWSPMKRNLLEARIFAKQGNFARVLPIVESMLKDKARVDGAWELLVVARAHQLSYEAAQEALMEWIKVSPQRGYQGLIALAQAMEGQANDKAIDCYKRAFAIKEPQSAHAIRMAEALVRDGRANETRSFLETLVFPEFGYERRRLAILESV